MNKKRYQPLTIPSVTWNQKTLTSAFGELIAQPLEPGFGITLGNALRRVLLGGVEGSAVTSVIIHGVNNEFSSLEGVSEDAMQVILNIKGIIIRNKTGMPGKMSLQLKGSAVARVGDIVPDEHLELVNKDHVLAHVAEGGTLTIDFFVESGRGYQRAKWPADKALQEDGRIYIDAMLSPVRKVVFDVEKTRVGSNIDYDRLILKIHTDGSETPVDVLHYAVSVQRSQLEHFIVESEILFNDISPLPAADEHKKEIAHSTRSADLKGLPLELLLKSIDELELSVRANNCLINADIKRIIDLVNLTENDTLNIKNFGRKSLNEVKDSLKAFGLSFGMNIKESDVKALLQETEAE